MDQTTELQQEIAQFQQLQEQYQMFSSQRTQMELQLREIENTLEKLQSVDESTPLFQNLGSVLVRVETKKDLIDELKEKVEIITRRVSSMKEQEDRLKGRLESMGTELNKKIQESGLM